MKRFLGTAGILLLLFAASMPHAAAQGIQRTYQTIQRVVFPLGTALFEDAANLIAQRNGTNGQSYYLYNTFTDASNYKRLKIVASGTQAQITTDWAGTGTSWDLRLENAFCISGSTGLVNCYGGSGTSNNTVGGGLVAIRGENRSVGATTAQTNQTSYTLGAADGTFEVQANVLVTTSTTHTFTATVAYTDESNTARTATLSFELLAGGTPVTSITNTNGAVPYMGVPITIRCKAATAINISTTGTFTTVTYNVEGMIKQIA